MRNDSLQQYIKLRRELTEERGRLQARLRQINEALGEMQDAGIPSPAASSSQAPTPARSKAAPARRGRKGSGGGGMSLREHVLATLREGPKTKDEILEAVQQRGYKFSTDNPLNSLGVILYGKNPKLNRVDGKFSLKGGASASSGPSAGGQHQMSAEGRARIAAAQRARWQKSRKDEGTKKAPKGTAATNGTAQTPKRKLSAAGRKAISEAARKRWADAKASGKTAL